MLSPTFPCAIPRLAWFACDLDFGQAASSNEGWPAPELLIATGLGTQVMQTSRSACKQHASSTQARTFASTMGVPLYCVLPVARLSDTSPAPMTPLCMPMRTLCGHSMQAQQCPPDLQKYCMQWADQRTGARGSQLVRDAHFLLVNQATPGASTRADMCTATVHQQHVVYVPHLRPRNSSTAPEQGPGTCTASRAMCSSTVQPYCLSCASNSGVARSWWWGQYMSDVVCDTEWTDTQHMESNDMCLHLMLCCEIFGGCLDAEHKTDVLRNTTHTHTSAPGREPKSEGGLGEGGCGAVVTCSWKPKELSRSVSSVGAEAAGCCDTPAAGWVAAAGWDTT